MQSTLQNLLVECTKAGKATSGGIDPSKYPSQILCLAEQVLFTERCEQAIQSATLSEFLIELESQLENYINIDLVSSFGQAIMQIPYCETINNTCAWCSFVTEKVYMYMYLWAHMVTGHCSLSTSGHTWSLFPWYLWAHMVTVPLVPLGTHGHCSLSTSGHTWSLFP